MTERADSHVAELAGLDGAAALLTDEGLSELLGAEVQATHLRLKPGHSVIVSHRQSPPSAPAHGDAAEREPAEHEPAAHETAEHGWTMLTDDADKFRKLLVRAEKLGQELIVHRAESPYLVSGSVWADRWLGRELAAAHAALGKEARWHIMRYNPRRRVVAVVDHLSSEGEEVQHVVRVSAGSLEHIVSTAERWRDAGLPVTRMKPLGTRGTAVTAPLWGHTDLLRDPFVPAARTAGRRIAELHASTAPAAQAEPPAQGQPAGLEGPALPPLEADVDGCVEALALIAPWLADRAEALAEKLTSAAMAQNPGAPVELHGDLSPDQILLAAPGSHKIRIIDLDRVGMGPAMRDVGSWTASCRGAGLPELAEAFLSGYMEIAEVDRAALAMWESYAHLASALDPFRNCETGWADKVTQRIESAEIAVEDCALPTP